MASPCNSHLYAVFCDLIIWNISMIPNTSKDSTWEDQKDRIFETFYSDVNEEKLLNALEPKGKTVV